MSHDVYQYTFAEMVPLSEVRDSLLLAAFCAEGLHGRAQVRLDADSWVDDRKRIAVVDATTEVGRTIARVFTTFLSAEFGDRAFRIKRHTRLPAQESNQPVEQSSAQQGAA